MKRKVWKVWRNGSKIVYHQIEPRQLSPYATAIIEGLERLQERTVLNRPWISPELRD